MSSQLLRQKVNAFREAAIVLGSSGIFSSKHKQLIMVKCVRCWVQSVMMGMNAFVNLCGAAMIIYSLWLEKMWYNGLHQLPYILNIPKPWFIYTCLSVGMAVCLSTVFGHAIANCLSNSALCMYVVALTSLLLLEVAVVVLIFFNINWSELIIENIDEHHKKFRSFVVFHLHMCRFILIFIVVLQVIVVIFAVILWTIGSEPRYGHRLSRVPDFKQSFLVEPNVLVINNDPHNGSSNNSLLQLQTCITCGEFCRNRRESLVSCVEGVIRARFRRRTVIDI